MTLCLARSKPARFLKIMSNVNSKGPAFLLRIRLVSSQSSGISFTPTATTSVRGVQHVIYKSSRIIRKGSQGSSMFQTGFEQNLYVGPTSVPGGDIGNARLLIRPAYSGIG